MEPEFTFVMPEWMENGQSLEDAFPVESMGERVFDERAPKRGRLVRLLELSDLYDGPPIKPERYFNGQFGYRPRADVVIAMRLEQERATSRADTGLDQRDLRVICHTCQTILARQWSEWVDESGFGHEHRHTIETMFGVANDHIRTTMNHAVSIEYEEEPEIVFFAWNDKLAATM